MQNNRYKHLTIPLVFLLISLAALPIRQLIASGMMPGDLGDARLNNYFLENIYQFLVGNSPSLWHFGFFTPFPFVLGFSDNHFGTAPFYLIPRLITGQPDTAFQIWFLLGYIANFSAAYYALRKLECSPTSSSIGALIFAFALPTSAHAGHAQLHYRFGIPLAVAFFAIFLKTKEYRLLVIAAGWTVWQFYCGIYMGFFTLLFLASATAAHLLAHSFSKNLSVKVDVLDFFNKWKKQGKIEKWKILIFLIALLGFLVLLFYPYIQVSLLYGAKRSWDEISVMLPRIQSYFLSDASYLWSSFSSENAHAIPMRHEHQMFIGIIPILLVTWGLLIGMRKKDKNFLTVMVGMSTIVMALTISIGGFSLWYLFHKFPLASAIRAMTRIDQVLLFPAAYISATAIDHLRKNHPRFSLLLATTIAALLIIEFSATSITTSPKNEWRNRTISYQNSLPEKISDDAILFFAQKSGPYFADELDAMWVSLLLGKPTLNGYSGIYPPGYSSGYGNDCSEIPKRIMSYVNFTGGDYENTRYRELINRVVPIGFTKCKSEWLLHPPQKTYSKTPYSAEELSKIHLHYSETRSLNGKKFVYLKAWNSGEKSISSDSIIKTPIRISWRFLDAAKNPSSGWEHRANLPFDIPAKEYVDIIIPITSHEEIENGTLQFSVVQESLFWMHDKGVHPLEIPWNYN